MKEQRVARLEDKWGGGAMAMRPMQLLGANDYCSFVHLDVPTAIDAQSSNSWFFFK